MSTRTLRLRSAPLRFAVFLLLAVAVVAAQARPGSPDAAATATAAPAATADAGRLVLLRLVDAARRLSD